MAMPGIILNFNLKNTETAKMSALNNKPDAKDVFFQMGDMLSAFFATTVNYMDRQVLSLTWKEFIAPEFHWMKHRLWCHHINILYHICGGEPLRRKVHRLDGGRKRLSVNHIHMVGGRMSPRSLRLGDGAHTRLARCRRTCGCHRSPRFDGCHYICVLLHRGACDSRNRRGRKLPRGHQGDGGILSEKDRAFATSIFNAGATVGALLAPVSIPALASYFQKAGVGNGWEMAFLIIGGLGFIWMGFWMWLYRRPESNPFVNKAELEYIEQDNVTKNETPAEKVAVEDDRKNEIPFLKCFKYRQTWAIFFGRFLTDGVWWFFLFWTPAYISDILNLPTTSGTAQMLIVALLSAYPAFDLWRQNFLQ